MATVTLQFCFTLQSEINLKLFNIWEKYWSDMNFTHWEKNRWTWNACCKFCNVLERFYIIIKNSHKNNKLKYLLGTSFSTFKIRIHCLLLGSYKKNYKMKSKNKKIKTKNKYECSQHGIFLVFSNFSNFLLTFSLGKTCREQLSGKMR